MDSRAGCEFLRRIPDWGLAQRTGLRIDRLLAEHDGAEAFHGKEPHERKLRFPVCRQHQYRGRLEFKPSTATGSRAASSVLHDFNSRLTLGVEAHAGVAHTSGLGRTQLQGLIGGEYALRDGCSRTFGLLGGRYEASPRIGGQIGVSVDFPAIFQRSESTKTAIATSMTNILESTSLRRSFP